MNNQPAFPSGNDVTLGDWKSHGHSGMTLRDYFAAKAMQSLVLQGDTVIEDCAILAYEMADAMLKERAK
tara:strand:+ start:51 stop:257 length:207 start_codon:yes stop_codon:yes gene_type:complete